MLTGHARQLAVMCIPPTCRHKLHCACRPCIGDDPLASDQVWLGVRDLELLLLQHRPLSCLLVLGCLLKMGAHAKPAPPRPTMGPWAAVSICKAGWWSCLLAACAGGSGVTACLLNPGEHAVWTRLHCRAVKPPTGQSARPYPGASACHQMDGHCFEHCAAPMVHFVPFLYFLSSSRSCVHA